MHTLTFEALHEYDAGDPGITVPVELSVGEESVKVTAKLDSGSTFCVFRRARGTVAAPEPLHAAVAQM